MSLEGLVAIRGTQVQIEQAAETRNAIGEMAQSWPGTVVATVQVLIQPLGGRELEVARQRYATVTHRIVIAPYVAGVKPKMRVTKGTRVFDIDAVLNIEERSQHLELMVTERNV